VSFKEIVGVNPLCSPKSRIEVYASFGAMDHDSSVYHFQFERYVLLQRTYSFHTLQNAFYFSGNYFSPIASYRFRFWWHCLAWKLAGCSATI